MLLDIFVRRDGVDLKDREVYNWYQFLRTVSSVSNSSNDNIVQSQVNLKVDSSNQRVFQLQHHIFNGMRDVIEHFSLSHSLSFLLRRKVAI